MFYKLDNDGKWWDATVVHLPNGVILSPENKISVDGWSWLDEPPIGWIEQQPIIEEEI